MKVVNHALLREVRSRGVCEWSGKVGPTEAAHVLARGHGGGTRLDVPINLVALSPEAHQAHHNGGKPTRQDLLEIVAKREGKSAAAIWDELMAMLRAPKKEREPRKQRTPKPRKVKPVVEDAVLKLEIGEDSYKLDLIPARDDEVKIVYRLTRMKVVGESEESYRRVVPYDVFADAFGLHCDCKSGTLRPERTCKHVSALLAAGLLHSTEPQRSTP